MGDSPASSSSVPHWEEEANGRSSESNERKGKEREKSKKTTTLRQIRWALITAITSFEALPGTYRCKTETPSNLVLHFLRRELSEDTLRFARREAFGAGEDLPDVAAQKEETLALGERRRQERKRTSPPGFVEPDGLAS